MCRKSSERYVTGNYTQGSNAALDILLGGSQDGLLAIVGTASLDGILNVSLFGGFIPSGIEDFTILTYNNGVLPGDFAVHNFPTVAGGFWTVRSIGMLEYVIEYNGPVVAPEPGTPALLLIGGVVIRFLRRRSPGYSIPDAPPEWEARR